MSGLSARQSRALAIGLLILVLLILIRVLLVPLWTSWRDYGSQIDALENRLAVYERAVSGLESSRERLAHLKAARPATDWYLNETTPALSAAGLQQLLHRQVSANGGQVISTQIIDRDEESPLEPVAIQVHLRGELVDLVGLLYTLESGRPVLFVDNLRILANPRRQPSTQRTNAQRQLPALDIRFDLIGYTGQERAQ
ncbi:type II secretion system protein GspM [Marinobacterium lutimaris]|uniref:General secretion pathway protein M n=1 Tax=Marinobacterium lutimaris TaxID=568106 RepID=A0A1H5WZ28_9GAMM|nr:type II secretion system protein GspM [Marinobacterium lutimaris]SEG04794.1 general secretion pathway protein M [Marinobacterium lutimaris]